ncbi:MAG: ABC transporter permease [Halobacteriaceae archaeon]
MTLLGVARDDFRNARRSYVVLGVIGVLAAFVALIVYSVSDYHADAFRALFDVSFFFFLVFPLILVPLTYLSIAGDRERGSIKHALGLPNTRAAYVFGTFLSRVGVAVAAVLISVVVAAVVGGVAYAQPLDLVRFAWFAAVSALFVASMTAVFVACSAVTSKRSRAMFGVVAAYFLLGPFWFGFLPVVSLETVVRTVADVLGTTISDETFNHIRFSSPTTAYLAGLEPVYDGVLGTGEYPRVDQNYVDASTELYEKNWYNWLTMTAWGAVALAVGYARFRVAELG